VNEKDEIVKRTIIQSLQGRANYSMKKRVVILIMQIFVCSVCFAQTEKIDSLKKALPLLRDSARVDCLNALCGTYLNLENDSAGYFADQSYAESIKINYMHGIAESLSYKGEIKYLSNDFSAEEKLSLEAINWYRKTSNKKRLAETHLNLGFSLYAQSFFTEAVKNLDTAYELYKKNGDFKGMWIAIAVSAATYEESGNYEKAFELDKRSLDMAIENNDDGRRRYELTHIGDLYATIGDNKTALDYYRRAFLNLKPEIILNGSLGIHVNQILQFAELFTSLHQYDSAKYYYSFVDTTEQRAHRFYLISSGNFYFAQKQYDKALQNFLRGLYYHQQYNDGNQVMTSLVAIAKTYLALGNNDSAFKYANESLSLAKQTGAKQVIRDACEILSSVYDRWHQPDSAYLYYKQYTAAKDSILNDQVKGKLAAYSFEQKIELLNKGKQIQQAQLQKQSLLKNILIGSIIFLLLLAAIIFRNIILKRRNEKMRLQHELELQKLESDKTKAELQRQKTEVEMQALRAQMNPHFIFNSLNSINRFILQNNKAEASEYLTKFSKLVRMILQNSQASLVTLESELESLGLYLEMEALRFNHYFSYKISVQKDLDIEVLKVPPLIIQPYVENAIWHGLMHKEEKGELNIEISSKEDHLYFRITDNGIGRKKAAALASKSATKHKSMGLRITEQRIEMMQTANCKETPVSIVDLTYPDGSAAGTEVTIKIPEIYD
jgi:tetratricopeptide (TPR) repeat protein